MATQEELDAMDSEALADRALDLAKHRLDVGFFWDLLKKIPAAEAMAGDVNEAEYDLHSLYQRFHGLREADEGGPEGLAEVLRPVYTEYLLAHDGK